MNSDLGYLYHLHIGDCEASVTWYRHPILKITPRTIIIGGWHFGKVRLNRLELESKGQVWHKGTSEWYLTEANMRASPGYVNAPISDVPYDPEMFSPPPEQELAEDQKEWAEELCRLYFAKNPNGTVKDCDCFLQLEHDLAVPRSFIQRLGLVKKSQPVAVDPERRAALDTFVAAIQAGHADSHICFDEGPKWWRIIEEAKDGRRHVYGFVRREDGAIFQADGWKSPARDTGILGFLDNYDPDVLGEYSVSTEAGQRWRRLNNIAKK